MHELSISFACIFYQWSNADDDESFRSCLQRSDSDSSLAVLYSSEETALSPKMNLTCLLRRSLSMNELEDTAWLSSSLIDLVLSKFARCYSDVYFLAIDFVALTLNSNNNNFDDATDILGI